MEKPPFILIHISSGMDAHRRYRDVLLTTSIAAVSTSTAEPAAFTPAATVASTTTFTAAAVALAACPTLSAAVVLPRAKRDA